MSQSVWVIQLKNIYCVPIMSGIMVCRRDSIIDITNIGPALSKLEVFLERDQLYYKDHIQIYSYTQQLGIGRSLGSVSRHNRGTNLVLGRWQGYSQRKSSQRKLGRKGGKE